MTQLETYSFSDDGRFPNSPLPLLVYRGALPLMPVQWNSLSGERLVQRWRNGIFGYHHFHSIAHEVLGIAAGEAQCRVRRPCRPDRRGPGW